MIKNYSVLPAAKDIREHIEIEYSFAAQKFFGAKGQALIKLYQFLDQVYKDSSPEVIKELSNIMNYYSNTGNFSPITLNDEEFNMHGYNIRNKNIVKYSTAIVNKAAYSLPFDVYTDRLYITVNGEITNWYLHRCAIPLRAGKQDYTIYAPIKLFAWSAVSNKGIIAVSPIVEIKKLLKYYKLEILQDNVIKVDKKYGELNKTYTKDGLFSKGNTIQI